MSTSEVSLFVPLIAAFGAAIIAGVCSYLVGRGMRTHDWRLSVARDRMLDRRQIYARFLAEADAIALRSAQSRPRSVAEVEPLFALLAEISLIAPPAVCGAASRMCEITLDSLRAEGGEERDYYAAKSAFLEAARADLDALTIG